MVSIHRVILTIRDVKMTQFRVYHHLEVLIIVFEKMFNLY